MTFENSLKALIKEVVDSVPKGMNVAGISVQLLALPALGGGEVQSFVTSGHVLHQNIEHEEIKVLEDFIESLQTKVADLRKEEAEQARH